MSWTAIVLLGALSYGLKAAGLLVLDHVRVPRTFTEVTALLPPALLAALVVVQSFADGTTLVLDARAAGLGGAIPALVAGVNDGNHGGGLAGSLHWETAPGGLPVQRSNGRHG